MAVSDGGQPSTRSRPPRAGSALADALAGAVSEQGKPKRKRPPPPRRPRTTDEERAASSRATRQTARPRKAPKPLSAPPRRPKVDTGDILAGVSARDREALTEARPTRTVVVRGKGGKRTRVTVDTGDILASTSARELQRARERRIRLERPSFGEALRDELEGRGAIAQGLGALARAVGENGIVIGTGGGPAGAVAARGRGRGGGSGVAAALAPNVGRVKDAPLLRRGIEDLVNLPAVAIPSLYVPAAAAVEAAQGRPARGKQLGRDIAETDPVYAVGEAAIRLASGDTRGAGRAIKRAGKLANEHPGFAAVEALGVKGALGRGAGRTVRGTGKVVRGTGRKTGRPALETRGERIRRRAAVETRPDARVPGTAFVERREYSPDLINRAVQVRKDAARSRRAVKLRGEATHVESVDPDRAIALRKRANAIDPRVASDRQVRARVNLGEARGDNLRRTAVGAIDNQVSDIVKAAGDKGAAAVLVASGITRASVRDLQAYRAELTAAHAALKDPAKRAANVRLRRAIDVSVTAARKGGDPELRQVLAAAKRYSHEIDKPLDRVLSDMGLLDRARGERAKLIPVAARELGAKVSKERGLEAGSGLLSTSDLRALVAARREVDPSYVSQAPNALSAQAYYRVSSKEPSIDARRRTERPTLEGTFDASPEALRARAMNAQGLASAAGNFRSFIGEMAVRGRDKKVVTGPRARMEKAKTALEAAHGHEFAVVGVKPWAATREHIAALMDDINAAGEFDSRALKGFRDSLADALDGKGDGPFALIPAAAAKQARQHLRVLDPTDFGKGARALRSSFTRTVLTTSPGPTFGNLVEPVVRSAVMRAGPLSTVRGVGARRALKRIDPEAAKALEAVIGRGQVTLAARARYVDPAQFDAGFVRNVVAGFQAAKRARGAKQIVGAWNMWTHLVFEQVNGRAESFFRGGPMLGKALKNAGLMDSTLLGLSKQAMLEAAHGLRETPTQARLAVKLNDAYGKYGGFSPTGRKVIAELTPFAAWWLSSATFVAKVMPRDHPMLTGFIASLEQATEEWRVAQGLDLFAGKATLPGWLQGTIPAGKTGRIKAAYNTPAGAFTDPLESASSLLFPQGESLLKAFQGMDWKNAKLRHDDGSPYDEVDKALYAAGELLKSTVPAIAVPVRVRRYIDNPGALLNPVRVPPRKGTGDGAPLSASEEAEARAILREQQGSKAEQDALDREARAILREQAIDWSKARPVPSGTNGGAIDWSKAKPVGSP